VAPDPPPRRAAQARGAPVGVNGCFVVDQDVVVHIRPAFT
jgi:hypothetical protein